jgi:hypothetical protein
MRGKYGKVFCMHFVYSILRTCSVIYCQIKFGGNYILQPLQNIHVLGFRRVGIIAWYYCLVLSPEKFKLLQLNEALKNWAKSRYTIHDSLFIFLFVPFFRFIICRFEPASEPGVGRAAGVVFRAPFFTGRGWIYKALATGHPAGTVGVESAII